ncbi:IS110 family transposase [Actinosynnema sp. NPDC004786]
MAIETPRGLLVAGLRQTARQAYSIIPMAVARYRGRRSVSRKKSDHVDAMILANILRTDAHAHRPLLADSELAQAVVVLSRAIQDAIWRRSRATQELRAVLREYYPGFLAAFAKGGATDLASSEARVVLALAPTPAAAAKITKVAHRRGPAPCRSPTRHRRLFDRFLGQLHHCLQAARPTDPIKAFDAQLDTPTGAAA